MIAVALYAICAALWFLKGLRGDGTDIIISAVWLFACLRHLFRYLEERKYKEE